MSRLEGGEFTASKILSMSSLRHTGKLLPEVAAKDSDNSRGLAVGSLRRKKKEGKVLLCIDAMATTTTTPSTSQSAPATKPKVEADESNFHRIRITLSSTKLEALEKGSKIIQTN